MDMAQAMATQTVAVVTAAAAAEHVADGESATDSKIFSIGCIKATGVLKRGSRFFERLDSVFLFLLTLVGLQAFFPVAHLLLGHAPLVTFFFEETVFTLL